MPPRHHYWTIILEGKPTAFRTHTEEELLPTLRQLQVRHPDAVMKWFARGRLWNSQDEERADAAAKRRPTGAPSGDRRPRDWRPGGEHKDPRDRFKISRDEKRRRFAENLHRERREPDGTKERPPRPDAPIPFERPARPPQFNRPPRSDRPPQSDRPPRSERPDRPREGGGGTSGSGAFGRGPRTERPRGDRVPQADRGSKPPWTRGGNQGREDRPWNRDRPGARPGGKPPGDRGRDHSSGDRPASGRPPSPRPSSGRPPARPPFGRPPSGRPPSGRPPSGRPPSGRPPGQGGGRPPGAGGRSGSRPPGGRKPGGGGRKGGGGSGR